MPTIAETLKAASLQLKNAEVPNDILDAQTLLAYTIKQDRTYLIIHFTDQLPEEIIPIYQSFIARRCTGEPLQYITGRQEFFGLEFEVTPAVLIPRPETELIIEETLRLAENIDEPLIIDAGTGSGCIAIALARELPNAKILATDISAAALEIANKNALKHGVQNQIQFIHCDLLNGILKNTKADFIVSNPPYIAPEEIATLQREVRDWEPHNALTDFADGLNFYRRLLIEAVEFLQPEGYLIFEMGYEQAEKISSFVDRKIWSQPITLQDLQGIPRTMILQLRTASQN
jgi:release factor glutamine methyltransferase